MMTFKSFTSVEDLFELLVERFNIQPPPNLSPKELENWGKLKQHVIQMRFVRVDCILRMNVSHHVQGSKYIQDYGYRRGYLG